MQIDGDLKRLLERQGYKLVGGHSAVKTCHWLKEKLLNNRSCYKSKFYGIESHRCLQMTPSVAWCQHRCVFCWRPTEHTIGTEMPDDCDDPVQIVDGAIEAQRKLISGYRGETERVSRDLFMDAWHPRHAAISLAGEPTIYPHINGLIEEFHRRDFTTFLVTNGQEPERLEEIVEPTQLYLSLEAYDEELYKKIDIPQLRDGWARLNRSLELLPTMDTRTVLRLTLVRGYNLDAPERFAPLIEKAEPDYIEAKGYVHVGYSRRRLRREDMPSLSEIREFSAALSEATGYGIKDEDEYSKVVLLEGA